MTTETTNENRRKDDARPAVALTWTDPAPAVAQLGDVMLDAETLGTTPGSAILSIGAVTFGPAGLGDEFYAPISLASCTAMGLTIDPATVAWWMKQSDAARAAAFRDDAEPLPRVLLRFAEWFERAEAERPWCQGANFDAPLLEAAYRACSMTPPWKFWNVRDTRTLYELADVKVDRARGTHHNALDDARAQAEAAVVALQRLQDARRPAEEDATGSKTQSAPVSTPECALTESGGIPAANAEVLLDALQKAARLLRAAGFAMTGTATSQIVAAINAAAGPRAVRLDRETMWKIYGIVKGAGHHELASTISDAISAEVDAFLAHPAADRTPAADAGVQGMPPLEILGRCIADEKRAWSNEDRSAIDFALDNLLGRFKVQTERVTPARTPATSAGVQPPFCTVPPAGWHCTRTPGHDGPCAAHPGDRAPAVDVGGMPAVTAEELAAFNRFCECAEDFDSGGHDVPKVMMKRLAVVGLVRPCGFGRYETTLFGDAVRNHRTPAKGAADQGGAA